MGDTESYLPPNVSRQHSLSRPMSAAGQIPGRANGRLEYGLHEMVVRVPVPAKVKEAKKAVEASRPDILGQRTEWKANVSPDTARWGKHVIAATDEKLSNTLLPQHIVGKDMRHAKVTAFTPGHPAVFDRGTAEWGTSTSTWNTSTYELDARERSRALMDATTRGKAHSLGAATRLKGTAEGGAGYVSPMQRQQLNLEQMREQKRNTGVDYEGMVQKWGKEGADHLLHIAELEEKLRQRGPTVKPKQRGRVKVMTKSGMVDVAAVKALDGGKTDEDDDASERPEPKREATEEDEEDVQAAPEGSGGEGEVEDLGEEGRGHHVDIGDEEGEAAAQGPHAGDEVGVIDEGDEGGGADMAEGLDASMGGEASGIASTHAKTEASYEEGQGAEDC